MTALVQQMVNHEIKAQLLKVAEISEGINDSNLCVDENECGSSSLHYIRVSFMTHFYLSGRCHPPHLPPPALSPDWPRGSSCLLPGDGAARLGLTGGWWLLSAAEEIKLELLLAAL